MPIVVAFLAAILVACLQNRSLDFDKKLEIMAQGVGDKKYHHYAFNLPCSRFLCWGCGEEAVLRSVHIVC